MQHRLVSGTATLLLSKWFNPSMSILIVLIKVNRKIIILIDVQRLGNAQHTRVKV